MEEKKKKKISGYICLGAGAVFFLVGIVFFIMSNWVNLYAQKVVASVVAQYDVTLEDGKQYKMLDVVYHIGNQLITTTMEYDGDDLAEDAQDIEIYYNVKKPKMIIDGGWTFWPLALALLGGFIILPGLTFLGIVDIGIFEPAYVSKHATEKKKQIIAARERIANNGLPFLGAVGFLIFGIVSLVTRKGWYSWLFLIAGIALMVYFGLELIPAIIKWIQLRSISKVKVQVVETEMNPEEENDEFNSEKDIIGIKEDNPDK